MTSKETPWEPKTWNWAERVGIDEIPVQRALKRSLLGCVVPKGGTGDKAEGTLSKKRLSEKHETRLTERLLILASIEAATVGMCRSKGRHMRQGRRNTFKEAPVGDTGDKTDGTLVVLG